MKCVNPFHRNVLFLYPLKTSEIRRIFGVFRGYRNGILASNGLMTENCQQQLVGKKAKLKTDVTKEQRVANVTKG